MIRTVVSSMDMSLVAQIALVMFVVAFLMILFAAAMLSQKTAEQYAQFPLEDDAEETPNVH